MSSCRGLASSRCVRNVEVRPLFHPGAHGSDLQIKRTREPSPAR